MSDYYNKKNRFTCSFCLAGYASADALQTQLAKGRCLPTEGKRKRVPKRGSAVGDSDEAASYDESDEAPVRRKRRSSSTAKVVKVVEPKVKKSRRAANVITFALPTNGASCVHASEEAAEPGNAAPVATGQASDGVRILGSVPNINAYAPAKTRFLKMFLKGVKTSAMKVCGCVWIND
jgi:hypothetical protein